MRNSVKSKKIILSLKKHVENDTKFFEKNVCLKNSESLKKITLSTIKTECRKVTKFQNIPKIRKNKFRMPKKYKKKKMPRSLKEKNLDRQKIEDNNN